MLNNYRLVERDNEYFIQAEPNLVYKLVQVTPMWVVYLHERGTVYELGSYHSKRGAIAEMQDSVGRHLRTTAEYLIPSTPHIGDYPNEIRLYKENEDSPTYIYKIEEKY